MKLFTLSSDMGLASSPTTVSKAYFDTIDIGLDHMSYFLAHRIWAEVVVCQFGAKAPTSRAIECFHLLLFTSFICPKQNVNAPYVAAGPKAKKLHGTDLNLDQSLESSLAQFGPVKLKLDHVNHSQPAIPEQEKQMLL